MFLRAIISLSLLVLTSGELEKRVRFKSGKACDTNNESDVFIQLGKLSQRPGACKAKCVQDENCVAVQYTPPRSCMLWYNPIDSLKTAEPGTFCGSAREVETGDLNPSPTPEKNFVIEPYTRCPENLDWGRVETATGYTDRQQCQQNCHNMASCKSFQWNGKRETCLAINYKVTTIPVKQTGPERVCGYLAEAPEKNFVIEPYTRCPANLDWERVEKATGYTDRQQCQQNCHNMASCKSFQWNGKRETCLAINYKVTTIPVKQTGPERVCGYLAEVAPTPEKNFVIEPYTRCPANLDWDRVKMILDYTTRQQCEDECHNMASCKSFQWNGILKTCLAINYKVTTIPVKQTGPERVCGYLASTPSMCTLQATLAFPFDEPSDAPYYGYHACNMKVTEAGASSDDVCSYDSSFYKTLPEWCTYTNSDPNGDSAYVANIDDNYYDEDVLTSETIEIFSAAGRTFNVAMSHYFFDMEYYSDVPGWEDYLMAPVLKINNMSHRSQTALSADGWSHPPNVDTPTHIKVGDNWQVNPDFKGEVTVTVTCDDNCLCDASSDLVSEKECTLQATLAFPFDTPNDAPYHGYNSEYMEITKVGDAEGYICSASYADDLPSWCTYENSDPNGDSAYVANLDDYYYDEDVLTSETIEIFNAAGSSFNFAVSHYYFGQDYYPDRDGWEDHAMATVLKINNESHATQNELNTDGWSHPTDINTPTLIEKPNGEWDVNPDYQGKFILTVTCDDNCLCGTSYSLV